MTRQSLTLGYAHKAPDCSRIVQPVLFVNGDYDLMNSIIGNQHGEPMRAACADLTVTSLPGAHWLPLRRQPELVNAIGAWLESKEL